MIKIPVNHYESKIEGSVLFRYPNYEPFLFKGVRRKNGLFDYKVYAYDFIADEDVVVDVNDGTWHFGIPVHLGNVFVFNKTFFPIMRPRSSYRYGINNRSVVFTSITGNTIGIFPDVRSGFLRMLNNEYYSIEEASDMIENGTASAVPISKDLYLKRIPEGLGVFFKKVNLGAIRGSTIIAPNKFKSFIEKDIPDTYEIITEDDIDEPDI